MSENSGPAGQGKSPSKPKTPTPSPSRWDPFESARNNSNFTPYERPATSPWTVGGTVTNRSVSDRQGEWASQFDSNRWIFNTSAEGISATDKTIGNDVIPNVALLGDYANRNAPWVNSAGNLNVAADAAAAWIKKNNGTQAIADARSKLIAKGWISGDAAKLYSGNGSDPILQDALTSAVTQISWTNYNRIASNMDLLTLDEGLDSLMQAPSTSSGGGSGSGGRYTQTTYQEFSADDYRIAVDKAYKEITGKGADEDTLNTYIQVLDKLQKKDPQKTVTTVSANGKNTTVKQSGGVSQDEAQDILLKKALADPETENYQKATTFMDYFNEAMKSKVNL